MRHGSAQLIKSSGLLLDSPEVLLVGLGGELGARTSGEGHRSGAGRDGRGPPVLRQARLRRRRARRPDSVHPRRPGHPSRVPGEPMSTESPTPPTPVGAKTIHFGLQVSDRNRSLDFSRSLGYEVVGTVPDTEIGHLTMLELPATSSSPSRWSPTRPTPDRPASATSSSRSTRCTTRSLHCAPTGSSTRPNQRLTPHRLETGS